MALRETDARTLSNQIDAICDQFDGQWRAGNTPKLEDFLQQLPAEHQSRLFRELLIIELEYRRSRGESPQSADYSTRFTAHQTSITDLFSGGNIPRDGTTELGSADTGTDAEAGSTASEANSLRWCGDYELLEEIGRGGMGVVYRARDRKLNRIVALKMIGSGELAGEEESRRFQAEAEAAARLDHPGIVPVYEVGEDGGRRFFSMAYLDGLSLAELIKDGPLPPQYAAELTQLVAEAVHYAHERGVVHRDLKPGNVLLETGGRPRITDFGLAKRIDADSELTASGQVLGTPAYMPPEQAAGRLREIGPLSDVYSLGALLYALLTGRPPFQAASVAETLQQVIARDPVSPVVQNSAVPHDLETICLKCLEKDPHRRYASAAALADDLNRFQNGRPIAARPVGRLERGFRWARRNPVLAATVGGLIATLCIGSAVATALAIYASANLKEAVAQRDRADENADRANVALKAVEGEQARTQAALDRAMLTFDKYVETVQSTPLLKEPRFKPVLKVLLADVLEHYRKFVEQHRHDPSRKTELALKLEKIGDISRIHGDLNDAISAYREAVTLIDDIGADPDSRRFEHRNRLSHNLANLLAESQQTGAAMALHRKALKEKLQILARNPSDADARLSVAVSLTNLAIMEHKRGSPQTALARFTEALEHFNKLKADKKLSRQGWSSLASCLDDLATLHLERDEFKSALNYQEEAVQIRERLVVEMPEDPSGHGALADSLNNLGNAYRGSGRVAESLTWYLRARGRCEQLVETYPTVTQFHSGLARTELSVGIAYKALGQHEPALKHSSAGNAILAKLFKDSPQSAELRRSYAMSFEALGSLKEKTGNSDAALADYTSELKLRREAVATLRSYSARDDLAECLNRLGILTQAMGRYEQSAEHFSEARRIWSELFRERKSPSDAVSAAGSLVNLAHSIREADTGAGLLRFNQAVDELTRLRKQYPQLPLARFFLRNACIGRAKTFALLTRHSECAEDWKRAFDLDDGNNRLQLGIEYALALAAAGKHARTIAIAEEMAGAYPKHGLIHFAAAELCAVAAESAAHDRSLAAADRNRAVEQYRDRAVKLLVQAEAVGWFKIAGAAGRLQQSIRLRSLADHPAFVRLKERLDILPRSAPSNAPRP